MKNTKGKIQQYLKVPYHIKDIPDISLNEKVLLAHIYGFGAKGCWQSNRTLGEFFSVNANTIARRLKKIRKYLYIKNPGAPYRKLWAKAHPQVTSDYIKNDTLQSQKCNGNRINNATVQHQKCNAISIGIRKNITEGEIASPRPGPSESRASATPNGERRANPLLHLTSTIGKSAVRRPWTPEEIEAKKQKALAQYYSSLELEKNRKEQKND